MPDRARAAAPAASATARASIAGPGGVGGPGVGGIGNRPASTTARRRRRCRRHRQPTGHRQPPGGVGGVGGIGNRPGIDNRPGGVGGVGNRPGIGGSAASAASGTDRGSTTDPAGSAASEASATGRASTTGRAVSAASAASAESAGVAGVGGVGGLGGVGNRHGNIGSGNTINRGDVNVGGIRQNNLAGIGVDPGYGVRPPAYNNWRGAYWGYHQGWANGYWHGYHDNNAWGWGRFATGAAVGVTAWALGSSYYNWGYASYSNPYYAEAPVAEPIVIQQTIAGGEPQTVSVPALAYDYSQPINTQAAPPPAEVADPAVAKFDAAREAFRSGDYAGALRLTDEALKVAPERRHPPRVPGAGAVRGREVRPRRGPALRRPLGRPRLGLDDDGRPVPRASTCTPPSSASWSRSSAPTPSSTSGRFVLAYHYLTQGNTDAAVAQLKQVVALAPDDKLSAQLVKQFSKPGSEPETPPARPLRRRGNRPSRASCPATGRRARPRTRPSDWRSGTTGPSPGRSTPRARRSGSRGSGRSPTTCSRSPSRGKAGPWSAASPGRPTTGGTSA